MLITYCCSNNFGTSARRLANNLTHKLRPKILAVLPAVKVPIKLARIDNLQCSYIFKSRTIGAALSTNAH